MEYPAEAISEIVTMLNEGLKNPSYRVRENILKFYHYFYYNHVNYLKKVSLEDIIDTTVDDHPNVRNKAFEVIPDLIRIQNKETIQTMVNNAIKLVEQNTGKKDSKDLFRGVNIMMLLILSVPYEIENWTDNLITLILQNKKVSKNLGERFVKDFVPKFMESHKTNQVSVSGLSLSYENYSDLREVANPSTYFA